MWANLLSIVGAIKSIASIFKIIDGWVDKWNDSKIDKHYANKKARRDRLLEQIEKEKDDEKLRELHRKLRAIDSVGL